MKRLFILFAACVLLVSAQPAGAAVFQWAEAVKWFPGSGTSPGDSRYQLEKSLGAPDPGRNSVDFLALGIGGQAIFDFGTTFSGTVEIHETTFGSGSGHPEQLRVYGVRAGDLDFDGLSVIAGSDRGVANSGVLASGFNLGDTGVFTELGLVNNFPADGVNQLSLTETYRYLVLADATGELARTPSFDGFDVDAVGVSPVQDQGGNPVPLPGAVWLLGAGLAGLAGLRARRRV